MNTTDPTNAQFAAYRAMWAYFNAVLFGGELGHVILNFSRLARSLGFFAPERWRDGTDNVTHEISLNPAHLRRDNLEDAASTLVHEMAHLWRHGQPSPPRNGYHDTVWADKMVEVGLMPSDTAAPGGARCGYKMSHYIYVKCSVTRSSARCGGPRRRSAPRYTSHNGTQFSREPRRLRGSSVAVNGQPQPSPRSSKRESPGRTSL